MKGAGAANGEQAFLRTFFFFTFFFFWRHGLLCFLLLNLYEIIIHQ